MRYQHNVTFSSILVFFTLTSSLQAQTGDWQAVQNIEADRPIVVKVRRGYYCFFQYATDDELVCEAHRPPLFRRPLKTFPRAAVREVREMSDPHRTDREMRAGEGIGAASFALLYAAKWGPLGGLIGAFTGAIIGGGVAAAVTLFQLISHLHGKVIYKR